MIIQNILLPNLLTLIRLFLSPLLFPFVIVYLLPLDFQLVNFFVAILFVAFCLTDFFDGHYARKFNQITELGKLLDPIADKFLLCAAIIPLVAIGKIYFFWALIFIAREFFVMGLRLIARDHDIVIPVAVVAKCKTVFEMMYLGIVILQTNARPWFFYEQSFLFVSLLCSLLSAAWYTIFAYQEFKKKNHDELI